MRSLIEADLSEVFFNTEEFATSISHTFILDGNTYTETIDVIFQEKTEVVLDRSNEYGDSVAFVPSIKIKNDDCNSINSQSSFVIFLKKYGVSFIDKENIYITRVYLEDRE